MNRQPDPGTADQLVRAIVEILDDLRDGRAGLARAKLQRTLAAPAVDGLPEALAERTRDGFASAYGCLLGSQADPQAAEDELRCLVALYLPTKH